MALMAFEIWDYEVGREKLKYKLTFNESEPSIDPNQIIQQHDTCGVAGDKK